jgi:eukaryotic-like serine/threonine-protein kinase
MKDPSLISRIPFGIFQLDLESGELLKNGRRIRLQAQPFQVLRVLLEKPGRVVTREELQQKLWPKDTFVDFEHGLNAAINRLRQVLDDSADTPRYIETLPRRGYRFIFPLGRSLPGGSQPSPSPTWIGRAWSLIIRNPDVLSRIRKGAAKPNEVEASPAQASPAEIPPQPPQIEDLREREGNPVAEDKDGVRSPGGRIADGIKGDYSLAPGHRLGAYEIVSFLAKGGMGEVYRAEDKNLVRPVAIKVLPSALSNDSEQMARFEREARLLASLNHTNIASIYGLDHAEGKQFIVMELVEGETLSERISRGPLAVEEALAICRQIAEGLENAHEKGIIHRDLKPSNVMVSSEGKVKILDFGLAKAFDRQSNSFGLSQSPTITDTMTNPGAIIGTAAYMSPEQAKGQAVDKRTDIWAFGCILYECLSGIRTFGGESAAEVVAKVLGQSPDWNQLPGQIPSALRMLLQQCLQKDPRMRFHDIADVRIAMGALGEMDAVETESEPAPQRRSIGRPAVYAAVVLLAGILVGLALIRYFHPSSPALMATTTIRVEPGHILAGIMQTTIIRPTRKAMAISRDGRFIVYCAAKEWPDKDRPEYQTKSHLYLRKIDQLHATLIPGTEMARSPFLSPDNRWIGYWTEGHWKKIPVEGGVAETLCDTASSPMGADWGPDNRILFSDVLSSSRGLSIVSAAGGKPEALTHPDSNKGEASHRLPSWLPNGKAALFTITRYASKPSLIALLDLDSHKWHVLLEDAADARYVSTGHLVFLRQGTLMAVRFNLATLSVVGQPVALLENVMQAINASATGLNTHEGQFDISDSGALVYAEGGVTPSPKHTLVWVDQKGMEQPAVPFQSTFPWPRLSPDGQRIAYRGPGMQIWIYDLIRGTNSRLTSDGEAIMPVWSPDGKRILFSWTNSSMNSNLFWQPYDESTSMERLATSDSSQQPGSWSPNGETVAFVTSYTPNQQDIALLDIRSRQVKPFLNSKYNEFFPEFSPDGRWIAFTTDETGQDEVYVRPFPNSTRKYSVSSSGGIEPLWARNGKQLFYRGEIEMFVADVRTDGGFSTSKPRLLFEKPGYVFGYPVRTYDISLDGQRFLMVKREEMKPSPLTEMILVQNWTEELKRRAAEK